MVVVAIMSRFPPGPRPLANSHAAYENEGHL